MKDLYLIGSLPGWWVAVIGVATAALLLQQFFGLRKRLPIGQSSILTALRALVYAVLIFFLLGPALIDKRVTKLRRPLTVLIDGSHSMGFPANAKSAPGDKNAKSRLDLGRDKLDTGANDSILQ
jgi:hypothetical protein